LSAFTPAIQEKATSAYIALNPADAEKLGLQGSDGVQVEHNGALPVILRESLAPGSVGVSVGLAGLNFWDFPAVISLNKADGWQSPASWKAANIIVSDRSVVHYDGSTD
jgi:anaerobic selenocysteine-containing dehydrogenase